MHREDMKFDVRAIKFLLRRNEVSREDYDKYLAALPDEAKEGQATTTHFVATFEDKNYRE